MIQETLAYADVKNWEISVMSCTLVPPVDKRVFAASTGEWCAATWLPPPSPNGDRITYTIVFNRRGTQTPPRTLHLTVSESSLNSDGESTGSYRRKLFQQIEYWLEGNEPTGFIENMG